jgi:phage shock protein E
VLRRWTGALIATAVLLTGCASSPDQAATAQAVTALTADSASDEIATRVLIDVRTPAEHAEGNLAGSLNIDVSAPGFREQIGALPRDGAYLVYCRSGNRSAQAAAIMAEMGFTDVVDGGAYADLAAAS